MNYFLKILCIYVAMLSMYTLNAQKPEAGQTYNIQSALEGKYLDVQWAKKDNGTPLHIWPFNGKIAQTFTIEAAGNNYFYIKSAIGKYIHVNGANKNPQAKVSIWTGKGNDNTKWKFIDAGNGYCYIQSKLGTNLDVKGGKSNDGTPIWMWGVNNTNAQKWKFNPAINTGLDDIEIIKLENFGKSCITTAEGHLKGDDRNIGTATQARVTTRLELVNNSIRATVNVKMNGSKISATWSKIVHTNNKTIEAFDTSYHPKKQLNFNTSKVIVNEFDLPKGGADYFDCHKGTTKTTSGGFGKIKLVGDTGGTDITTDYDCNCDARLVDIVFNDIIVKYKNSLTEECPISSSDRTKPSAEFTIFSNNFQYTFSENDIRNPNNFELELIPGKSYQFKLKVEDENSINKVEFKFLRDLNIEILSSGWKKSLSNIGFSYQWDGNRNDPKCSRSLYGNIVFELDNGYTTNEVFGITASDFNNNQLNIQIDNIVAKKGLIKEKVNYQFDYK